MGDSAKAEVVASVLLTMMRLYLWKRALGGLQGAVRSVELTQLCPLLLHPWAGPHCGLVWFDGEAKGGPWLWQE